MLITNIIFILFFNPMYAHIYFYCTFEISTQTQNFIMNKVIINHTKDISLDYNDWNFINSSIMGDDFLIEQYNASLIEQNNNSLIDHSLIEKPNSNHSIQLNMINKSELRSGHIISKWFLFFLIPLLII